MSSLEIIHCDPLSVSKRRYVARVPEYRWLSVRNEITTLHRNGWKHKAILVYLKSQRGLNITPGQLGSKMSEWKLFTYRTTGRHPITISPTNTLFRDDLEPSSQTHFVPSSTTAHSQPQIHIPLYSTDPTGSLTPDWSAFLLRAAKGDSQAMKTICILAKSQRFKRTPNDYLLYQEVIEAVQCEVSSPDTLSLQVCVMVYHAILALAIQAGFMGGERNSEVEAEAGTTLMNEPAIHLNAAGYMLGRINVQTRQHGCQESLKQLVDFFHVASYLLALSRCARSEVTAWPLLMYRLIVQ